MPDTLLDARGLACPLPILKTIAVMRKLPAGATLEVLATDPGSVQDFEAYCERHGHHLVVTSEHDGVMRFVIQRAAQDR